MTKVAINGFGRIGRLVARAILERPDCGLELVSVNDLADAKSNAWLFKHDSVHGKFPGEVTTDGNDIVVDGKRIHVTAERDPAKLPHKANGIDIALECTGFFTDRDERAKHLDAGAKKVLISAPAKGVDLTVVYGVNDDKLTAEHEDRFQRVVHDQLPGAGRQGAERRARHRARADDDRPRLHQRPEDPRPDPFRPAPRPRGGDVDDPDDDWRRPRGRRGASRAQGQARRLGDPRAGARRSA